MASAFWPKRKKVKYELHKLFRMCYDLAAETTQSKVITHEVCISVISSKAINVDQLSHKF